MIGRAEETRRQVDPAKAPEVTVTYQREAAPGHAPGIPASLGRYRLIDELGAGAFGRVYRGYDSELQRTVAIKILKTECFANQDELSRFFDEARLMASVHHPGIVAVHDVGIDEGAHFIVTQLITGGTLHDRLARGSISHVDAAELIRQCADAIHAAHKVQLYHRDLKPKNILLDDRGRAYVCDFGLAIRRRDQVDRIGEFAGSVNFMSPEQLRGDVHFIDGRTDVWALGVILYLMLTGKLPFQGSPHRLLTEISVRDPIPPRQLEESIPVQLERICLKCLSKPLDLRYQTAFDLAEDLGRFLVQNAVNQQAAVIVEPSLPTVPVGEPQPSTMLLQPLAKKRWSSPIAIVVAALLLLGTGLLGFFALTGPGRSGQRPGRQQEPVTKPRSPFEIDAYSTAGRPYPLLEVSPPDLLWPQLQSASSAHFDYVEARQELLVEAPEECLVGLGQTESENVRARISIKRYGREGFVGYFWGFQDATGDGAEREQRCHAILLQTVALPTGHFKLTMHRARLTFRKEPSPGTARFEYSLMSGTPVTVKDIGPHDLDLVIHRDQVTSVKWCGDELPRLHDSQLTPGQTPLSSRGVFGVVVIDSSARFSDARMTFFDKRSKTTNE